LIIGLPTDTFIGIVIAPVYAFVLSVATMVIVSLLTEKPSEKIQDETMTGFYIMDRSTSAKAKR
jgi:hypothetical protein